MGPASAHVPEGKTQQQEIGMRTTRGNGRLALLAAVALLGGLAVGASGCIVDNTSAGSCYPDLYVNWQVTQVVNGADQPITCATAGAATVAGQVGGLTDQVACPAGASSGAPLYFPLDQTGNYSVNVQLLDVSGNPISQTGVNMPPPSIYVDCSGNTQSPLLSLSIN
jgi:hypothetical protein